jgi:hypothetical protein
MSRPVPARLAVCVSTAAVALLAGALLAPAAHADDEPDRVPGRAGDSKGVAQSKMTVADPFGRKWG